MRSTFGQSTVGSPNVGDPTTPNREGRRIARLFRQARELRDIRACDLDAILAEDEIDVLEFRSDDPGCTACLIRNPYGSGGGIWLAPGQNSGRRRFSLAHELGHYHIPRHRQAGLQLSCADADLRATDRDARLLEWEANDFAAELLMPFRRFSEDADRCEPSIASALRLSGDDMYSVSVTAAAWRYVQVTREPCAVILSQNGVVDWAVRSDAFRLPLPSRGEALSPETAAAAVFRGEDASPRPELVPPVSWMLPDQRTPSVLVESTHGIPSLNQVLSFLWLMPEDIEEDL